MKVIIIKTAWSHDEIFVGDVGILTESPNHKEFGLVKVVINGHDYNVAVDNEDYVPYSSLLSELF